MNEIRYLERVKRDLKRLPPQDRQRVIEIVQERLARLNSFTRGVKRLSTGDYRLRIRQYRVLFDRQGSVITVKAIRHRKDAY